MNEPPGVVKFGVLAPATERGNTTNVTADPGTVVPGVTSQSSPTVHPAVCVPTGWPIKASMSLKSAVPPPAGCTLYRYCAGATVWYVEMLYAP